MIAEKSAPTRKKSERPTAFGLGVSRQQEQQEEDDDGEHSQRPELTLQIGRSALLDRLGDLLHLVRALAGRQYLADQEPRDDQRPQRDQCDDDDVGEIGSAERDRSHSGGDQGHPSSSMERGRTGRRDPYVGPRSLFTPAPFRYSFPASRPWRVIEHAPPSPICETLGVTDSGELLAGLLAAPGRRERVTHVETLPGRPARHGSWPSWAPSDLVDAFRRFGIERPWLHQVEMAESARNGRSTVISTGTASGKSIGYLLPALTSVLEGASAPNGRGATILYLAPTKALAADQLRRIRELGVAGVRVATYDGDTPGEEREWVRSYANVVLTNPDMLHHSMLPGHQRWSSFLRSLEYVVVDEIHSYRGLFGAHVAAVLRRLRRVAAHYGSTPTFLLASASVRSPEESAGRLVGLPMVSVTSDASPRGPAIFVLWEPPLTDLTGERGAPIRRTAAAEVADLLADLVIDDARTLAFVRSRRGAEVVALLARHSLEEVDPRLGRTVAAYRAGYLPEERRLLEQRLQSGELRAVAATSALELGIDVSGLDAVLLAGWPGTRASLWQQAGRAGRAGQGSLTVFVARDDPLDTYLVHHPDAIFGQPVEATVFDPQNPYVLAPHLAAAAAELPLEDTDLPIFGPQTGQLLQTLVEQGSAPPQVNRVVLDQA